MKTLKKWFPFILIALFVGWFSYKFFIERKPAQKQSMALDWDQLDATGTTAPKEGPVTLKSDDKKAESHEKSREYSTLSQSDEEQFAAFDEMEKKWLASAQSVLGDQFYPQYLEMRDRNEKEKMQAYKEYHEYLRQKHGDKFSYNISEDQSAREKKINQDYLKELLSLVGEERFQKYLKMRDKINEENRRNNKEFLQVEF